MAMKKRRGPSAYTDEFRREAVALVQAGNESVAEVARKLGVHRETLQNWCRMAAGDGPSTAARVMLEEENRRLRQENARLLEEREILKKATAFLRQGCTMRFVFIRAHARAYHVTTMCRVLEVSKAGYYAWRARPLSDRVRADRVLRERIRQIHQRVKGRYGSPRVYQELRSLGLRCGKHRVARLMRAEGLRATRVPQCRVTTRSEHGRPAPANVLARDFAVASAPPPPPGSAVWMADITYLPTREGWLYLAVVLDRASRRVVGWSLRPRLDQALTLGALRMALTHHRPAGGLHHSDRGLQYACRAYRQLLAAAGFTPSMSRLGDCWDNAVVESFFATVTKELLVDGAFASRDEARRQTFEFIEVWYNRQRRHSSLGYRTPVDFEAELQQAG
ncbi:MAG: IS3 family transposase [Gemmatimonadaceae bacterium]